MNSERKSVHQPGIERLLDFQAALGAGSGITRGDDPRGREFDEQLKADEFDNTGLGNVARSLMENIRRLIAHASMPMGVFSYGRVFQEMFTTICSEHGRSPFDSHYCDRQAEDPDPTKEELEFMSAVESGLREWMLNPSSTPSHILGRTDFSHVAGFASVSWKYLPQIDATRDFQRESWQGSIVIKSWTMFESLSEDLWEAALNSHPTVLAALSGKPRSESRSGESDISPSARVSFNDLQRFSFEVRSSMGTILKNSVSFRSLAGIREAYDRAFSKHSNQIVEILDDPGLQYAAAVRNLLIHKGGIVDAEFRKQVACLPSPLELTIGEKFPVTGRLCAELADACRTCAVWLVCAVHAWIVGHPEKGKEPTA